MRDQILAKCNTTSTLASQPWEERLIDRLPRTADFLPVNDALQTTRKISYTAKDTRKGFVNADRWPL